MAHELIYTSAPRGIRNGASGYCTVACTRGMAPTLIQLLESLSVYKQLYPAHDPRAPQSPPVISHYRYNLNGKRLSILSRVCLAAADHTNRNNKFAHHLVIPPEERTPGGPAWLALQPGVFRDGWDAPPALLPEPRPLPTGDYPTVQALTWAEVAGDAGWAGVLAEAFLRRPKIPAFLVYEPGMPILELIAEALALIPRRKRWEVTFNTYFSKLPAGAGCAWRGCVPDSSALREARRFPRALVIDLTHPLNPAPECALAQNAREGTPPEPSNPQTRTEPPPQKTEFKLLRHNRRRVIRLRPTLQPPGDESP